MLFSVTRTLGLSLEHGFLSSSACQDTGDPPEAPSGEEAPLATGDRLQGETTWWEASSLRDVLLALHGGTRASLESKGCKFCTPSLWPGADTSEHLWSEGCSDVGSRL